MRWLAQLVTRRRRLVLALSLVFLPVAGLLGGSVEEHLSSGGFTDPSSESARAAAALEDDFHTGTPNLLLLVTAKSGSVDDPAVVDAGLILTRELSEEDHVTDARSYWSLGGAAPLRSKDGRSALVLARIPGDEDDTREVTERIAPRYQRDGAVISVDLGGAGEVFRQITERSERDLKRAELLTLPVTLVLLVAVFGGVVAAGLPLAVGAFAVVGTFLVLRLVAAFTTVSIFALNLTTAMGLGLAIDYSLFVVSRYREELRGGHDPDRALVRALHTAGRTVVFSAVTVAVSLVALLVFPLPFLRSFAFAGVGVVAMAAVGAVVVLPALLAVLGRRIDHLTLFKPKVKATEDGFWYRQARAVMARPVVVAVGVTAVLVALGMPFTRLDLGLSDDRVLPKSAAARQVNDAIRAGFTSKEASALAVVAAGTGPPQARAADVGAYAAALSGLPGVARVDAVTGYYVKGRQALPANALSSRFAAPDGTWLAVVPDVEPLSPAGERLVRQVRAAPTPPGLGVLVGGESAQLVDGKDGLASRLPLALALIAVATFVLLFLMVGSFLVPAKALVLNVLSLSATFGALVWVFQDGHLSGVLDFTATGTISIFTPLLLFCIAFGLSMDYEVFLLSRIKEEYDLGAENEDAVAIGLERTGRIVTAAALLLALVFVAFITAEVTVVKVFGVGLALAVLVDAFLIRGTLVPAFMRLAGRANWWAPRSVRRFHLLFGIWESEPLDILEQADRPRVGTAP